MGLTSSVRYDNLDGRVALVTGGGSGIGRAIVTSLSEQGVRVGFLDIDEKGAAETIAEASGPKPLFLRCDLTDIDALRAAVATIRDQLGPFDILVNNAANDDRHATSEVTPEYFDQRVQVNLRHFLFAVQAVVPDMIAKGEGSIVNLGSISWKVGQGNFPVYVACKAAITGLTRGLAREFGKQGVRVNTVVPGWVMTERQKTLWLTPEGDADLDKAQCLAGRVVADDIAAMVLFLASDQGRMCSSQEFIVDGGWV
ncbi:MAG TPA: SDR family oxidoreductase [Saliniramus sp.]|nr:SDR family oxidoreductase [Saliniramus sp.]